MNALKAALPNAEKFLKFKPQTDKLHEQRKTVKAELDKIKVELKGKDEELDVVRKQ